MPTVEFPNFAERLSALADSLRDEASGDEAYKCRARAIWEKDLQVRVRSSKYTFLMDDAGLVGEEGIAANPGQYLLGALVACQVMMVIECAAQDGIQVDNVQVEAEGILDLRASVAGGAGRAGFVEIAYTTTVDSEEPDELIEQLMANIESRCPIADTIRYGTSLIHRYVLNRSDVAHRKGE